MLAKNEMKVIYQNIRHSLVYKKQLFFSNQDLAIPLLLACMVWATISVYAAGSFEFSEGEDEVIGVINAMRVADSYHNAFSLLAALTLERPPLSYLAGVPLLWFLPVTEFTLRLPYVVFGILQLPLVFAISYHLFGRRASGVATVLFISSGIFAINRLTLGISVFIFLELLAFYWFISFAKYGKKNRIVWSFLATLAATLAFQDGAMFALSLGFMAVIVSGLSREVITGISLYVFGLITYAMTVICSYYFQALWFGHDFHFFEIGAIDHLIGRSGGLHPSNILNFEYFQTIAYYISVPLSALLLIGLLLVVVNLRRSQRIGIYWAIGFVLPHLLVWQFLSSRLEHPVFIFPIFSILAAVGLCHAFDVLKNKIMKVFSVLLVVGVLLVSFCWNQIYFNHPNWAVQSGKYKFIYELQQMFPRGHGMLQVSGYRTASFLVREIGSPANKIFLPDGMSGAIGYYSARTVETLPTGQTNTGDLQSLDGFLVLPYGSNFLSQNWKLLENHDTYQINKKDRPLLLIFDIRKDKLKSFKTLSLDVEDFDKRFTDRYNSLSDFLILSK